jgi:hypothetical protein
MKILEEQQIGENIVGFGLAGLSDQGPLNPDRRQRLHKLLDRTIQHAALILGQVLPPAE